MDKRIVITGGSGLIGSRLCELLLEEGFSPIVLSRNPGKVSERFAERVRVVEWDCRSSAGWLDYADGAEAIVNLAGAPIGSGRWTPAVMERIMGSRVDAGTAVLEAVQRSGIRPGVIIQGSAVGYYAGSGDEFIYEDGPAGDGFLASVVKRWEAGAEKAAALGARVAVVRTAMVLGRGSELLDRLLLPLRLFAGGPMGSGRQWVSWIGLEDEVRAILFLIGRTDLEGIFNLAAPGPVRNSELMKALGKAVGRPSWLRTPAFALRAVLGRMADELVLSGMRVMPGRLLDEGFEFRYPDIESLLTGIFGDRHAGRMR